MTRILTFFAAIPATVISSFAAPLALEDISPHFSTNAQIIWQAPTNWEPPKVVSPIAELEAIADFGSSHATVRLFSPILSSDVNRLLGKKY